MKIVKNLLAGFNRTVINPELGVAIDGYFVLRRTEGILDDIEINTLALTKNDRTILIMSLDVCQIKQEDAEVFCSLISDETGIPKEQIMIAATHVHTGPVISRAFFKENWSEKEQQYYEKLKLWIVESAKGAIADQRSAGMGWTVGHVPGFAYSRRFRMNDGSVRTNPGLGNPNVKHPIGEMDERVGIVRLIREHGDEIVLVNIGQHPDTVGGNKISADWSGFMRRTLERSIPGIHCIYLNGAEGDVGFQNIWAKGAELNDLTLDFDDVLRGYGHTRHMGNLVAGAVLQVYDKVNYCESENIRFMQKEIKVPANKATDEELKQAHIYHDLHVAGRDDEIPYKGMMLTTVIAEAERMVRTEHDPDYYSMMLTAFSIGNIALIGIPGEPFAGVGIELKKSPEWNLVVPVCNANGSEGYFPMREAYDEGGYEAKNSCFKAGVAELLIEEGNSLLKDLDKK